MSNTPNRYCGIVVHDGPLVAVNVDLIDNIVDEQQFVNEVDGDVELVIWSLD